MIASLCRDAGVTAVSEEAASTTTLENLSLAKPILARLGTTRVIIVTDWYHAPRAWVLARGLGLQASISCPSLSQTTWSGQLKPALREIAALPVALIRALLLWISAKP